MKANEIELILKQMYLFYCSILKGVIEWLLHPIGVHIKIVLGVSQVAPW